MAPKCHELHVGCGPPSHPRPPRSRQVDPPGVVAECHDASVEQERKVPPLAKTRRRRLVGLLNVRVFSGVDLWMLHRRSMRLVHAGGGVVDTGLRMFFFFLYQISLNMVQILKGRRRGRRQLVGEAPLQIACPCRGRGRASDDGLGGPRRGGKTPVLRYVHRCYVRATRTHGPVYTHIYTNRSVVGLRFWGSQSKWSQPS